MGILIKNQFENNIQDIFNNFNSIENTYGLKQKDILSLLEAKGKVKINNTISLLNVYNDIYKSNFDLQDLFNTEYIKGYLEYKNNLEINYGNEENSNFLDNILLIVKKIFSKVSRILKKNVSFEVATKVFDIRKIILILIIFILLLFFVKNIFNVINNNEDIKQIKYNINK